MSKLDLNKKLGFWPLEVEKWPKVELWYFFIKLTGRAHEHVQGPRALSESAEHPLPAWFIQSGALG